MPRFPLHRTMGPLGVTAAVASSWWLAGGISASACVAAYQPKGAASLAASYTNLANPGTNDAAPGVAPTWAAATGWTFNGTTQYLKTGVLLPSPASVIARFSTVGNTGGWVVGGITFTSADIGISPREQATRHRWRSDGAGHDVSPAITSGVMAIAGTKAYVNGVDDGVTLTTRSGTSAEIYIGAYQGPIGFLAGLVVAVALYNTTLSAAQVAAITTAMNQL